MSIWTLTVLINPITAEHRTVHDIEWYSIHIYGINEWPAPLQDNNVGFLNL